MIKARVSLDWEGFSSKPSSKLQYRDATDKYGNIITEIQQIGKRLGSDIEEVSPARLARAISEGKTWSPYVFNECPHWGRPRRLEHLFASASIWALDWDNGKTIEEVKKVAEDNGIQFSILHHSFSSTPEHPKLRGIIFCDEEVTDLYLAKKISIALANIFDGDRQCVDAARLFFGSKPDSIIEVNNKVSVSLEVLKSITNKVDTEKQLAYLSDQDSNSISIKSDDLAWGSGDKQKEIFSSLTPAKFRYAKKKILGILSDIKEYDGEGKSRYEVVWRSSARLARMPEVVGSAVYSWVKDSINNNPHFSDWDYNPDEVIMNAIEWGNNHLDEQI